MSTTSALSDISAKLKASRDIFNRAMYQPNTNLAITSLTLGNIHHIKSAAIATRASIFHIISNVCSTICAFFPAFLTMASFHDFLVYKCYDEGAGVMGWGLGTTDAFCPRTSTQQSALSNLYISAFKLITFMIQICAIGGYNEIGKNMTAVKVGEDVIILDMGLYLPTYIQYTEDEDIKQVPIKKLVEVGAIPDDSVIADWRKNVKAIVPTHAHLDHLGALPYISNKYNAEILFTPYTKELLTTICKDEHLKLKNPVKPISPNSKYKVGEIEVEFIHTTHSTPQAVMVALHTSEGIILYCNDFKFDSFPVLGKKPNFKRLEELGQQGVRLLICDSTRADDAKKTPSESVAREMLKDLLLGIKADDKAIIVTTFSSHIARLKSIIEYGKKINRKVLMLGRSLAKYVQAAERVNLVNFSKEVKIVKYSSKVQNALKLIEKNKHEYLLIVTGHQGETKAVLSKIARGELKFDLGKDDAVIFSCSVIPHQVNIQAREALENELKHLQVRIFKDIHVSGHAAREDLRDLIKMVQPKSLIPAHCEPHMKQEMKGLAHECGVKDVILMADHERITIE